MHSVAQCFPLPLLFANQIGHILQTAQDQEVLSEEEIPKPEKPPPVKDAELRERILAKYNEIRRKPGREKDHALWLFFHLRVSYARSPFLSYPAPTLLLSAVYLGEPRLYLELSNGAIVSPNNQCPKSVSPHCIY